MAEKIKRGPAYKKAQMDQRYQEIIRRFGSIEAYEQASQEGKSHKKTIEKVYKHKPVAGMRRFNRGGKV